MRKCTGVSNVGKPPKEKAEELSKASDRDFRGITSPVICPHIRDDRYIPGQGVKDRLSSTVNIKSYK